MDRFGPCRPVEYTPAYLRYGPDVPDSPVILSVPHAGRDYPDALLDQSRVRPRMLRRLEDRWVDLLAHEAVEQGCSVLIARAPRAMIDLNRHEREIDPAMVSGLPRQMALQTSLKLRGGLGLIPRRLPGAPELWMKPLAWDDVRDRIETLHRPYHAALDRMMRAARDAHGHAILLDLHSMPPLPPPSPGRPAPGLVLGDRFGRSAPAMLGSIVCSVAEEHGLITAHNHPYAGDHMLDRHGRPELGLHALQVELDRALYLDVALERPGPGINRMRHRDRAGALHRAAARRLCDGGRIAIFARTR